jgi:DNA-binding GntR family transcriptional regulator
MDGSIAPKAPSLTALARAELERLILEGRLAPGARLSEVALAERLSISRGPLREALRLLERDGLVVAGEAYRGTFVRRLDANEVAELYDTRALLQGFCCARVAERAGAAGIAALRAQVAAMAEAIDDPEEFYRLNVAFHHALLDAAGHARTATLYRGLEKESHLGRRQTMLRGENRRASNAEHAAIVDAIAAGDVAAAREAGEAHVLAGKRRWLAGLGG